MAVWRWWRGRMTVRRWWLGWMTVRRLWRWGRMAVWRLTPGQCGHMPVSLCRRRLLRARRRGREPGRISGGRWLGVALGRARLTGGGGIPVAGRESLSWRRRRVAPVPRRRRWMVSLSRWCRCVSGLSRRWCRRISGLSRRISGLSRRRYRRVSLSRRGVPLLRVRGQDERMRIALPRRRRVSLPRRRRTASLSRLLLRIPRRWRLGVAVSRPHGWLLRWLPPRWRGRWRMLSVACHAVSPLTRASDMSYRSGLLPNLGRKHTDLSSVTDVAAFDYIPKSSEVISAMYRTDPGPVT